MSLNSRTGLLNSWSDARANPRLLWALRKTVSTWGFGSSGYERMNETLLSVFHSVSNRAHGKRSRNSVSSAACYAFNSFFLSRARDFTIFTLHDLTYFYVERTTAQGLGAVRSLHILHIGRNATCSLFLMPLFKFTGLCLWYLSYFRIDQTI